MTTDDRRVCFVVMGFGKKTDYESRRTLDLDATYREIIKPAAEDAGLRCIRADEILHSGVIDVRMYEMLLKADLVIADISTGNVNAVYELGVRHALRPRATIIMKEDQGQLYFDLNHVATFKYRHLGDDIGASEARRAKAELQTLIQTVMTEEQPDSPVYTYIPDLQGPALGASYQAVLAEAEREGNLLANAIQMGERALAESRFVDAVREFETAESIKPQDPFILQKLALATYKSQRPDALAALNNGLSIVEILNPAQSNDPETLGLAGAIRKRLWQATGDVAHLDAAINFYGRGFDVRQDYYTGENLALCLDFRSGLMESADDAMYDRMRARKTREEIIELLRSDLLSPSFQERSDKKWVFATLAACSYALGRIEDAEYYENQFRSERPARWEIQTFEENTRSLRERNG